MRHGKKLNHLGRKSQHRKATLMNLANSLIVHKRIKTTVAKAKALRSYVEPLLTKSKDDSTHSRRVVFSYLKDKESVSELFRSVSVKIADRPGGYTRIIKLGTRYGDNAEMCYIELVDYNENLLSGKSTKKSTRRKRGSKKKTTEKTAEKTQDKAPESVDTVAEEEIKIEEPIEESISKEAKAESNVKIKETDAKEKVKDTINVEEDTKEEGIKKENTAEPIVKEELKKSEAKADETKNSVKKEQEPTNKPDEENNDSEESKK